MTHLRHISVFIVNFNLEKPKGLGYSYAMSRKTEIIKKSLSELEEIQKKLREYSQEHPDKELDDLQFEFGSQLKTVISWYKMLYENNGKSTSRVKVAASRENGKKGGRPPKALAEMKKRKAYLEELIPELYKKISYARNYEEETKFSADKTIAEIELKELEDKIANFKK